eukprot:9501462-Pyramimonas_sp.AAC.1
MELHGSTRFFPFGERFAPPPRPPPWTWTRGAAIGQNAREGPARPRESLREPEMASKISGDQANSFKPVPKTT